MIQPDWSLGQRTPYQDPEVRINPLATKVAPVPIASAQPAETASGATRLLHKGSHVKCPGLRLPKPCDCAQVKPKPGSPRSRKRNRFAGNA